MITWPVYNFPKPSVDYNIEVSTSTARTKMESGRFRQRARFTRDFRKIGIKWQLSDLQLGFFTAIYKHSLNNGADWFTISLPLGDDFKDYTARFVADSYSAVYDQVMYWNVSVIIETEDDASPYSADDIDALLAIDLDVDGFEEAIEALHEFTHVTDPAAE